jgi:molecular chaperone GrpE
MAGNVDETAGAAGVAGDGGEAAAFRDELAALNEKWLRALADLENYKKRTERERCRWSDQAREEILLALLSVVDDLDRALACDPPGSPDGRAGLRAGVELIRRQLGQVLERHGVVPIDTGGADFDPALHEAVCQIESPDHVTNQIVSETQKGYRLGDRLLRCSRVVVAK